MTEPWVHMVVALRILMNYPDGFDRQYNPAGKNEVTEVRFQSSLDGNWNYLLGAIHHRILWEKCL